MPTSPPKLSLFLGKAFTCIATRTHTDTHAHRQRTRAQPMVRQCAVLPGELVGITLATAWDWHCGSFVEALDKPSQKVCALSRVRIGASVWCNWLTSPSRHDQTRTHRWHSTGRTALNGVIKHCWQPKHKASNFRNMPA